MSAPRRDLRDPQGTGSAATCYQWGQMLTLSLPKVPALLFALLALPALTLPACDAEAASDAGPLVVNAPQVGFGRVFEGARVEHEWAVSVRAPVAVQSAKTDCGCTLARLERSGPDGRKPYTLEEPLAAGEQLFVRALYDTRGRRGSATRSVTLVPDAGAPLVLTLAADVQPWLLVEPADLAFARVRVGQGAEREFEVRSESGEPFALSASGRALAPWVRIELTAEEPDAAGRARQWKGRVRLGQEAPRGTFSYPLELVSDVRNSDVQIDGQASAAPADGPPRWHTTSPSWTLEVQGAVTLSAPTLEFGLVRADETVARSVRLESLEPGFAPDAVRARLEPLRPEEPFLLARTAALRTRPSGQSCEIELILAGLDPGVSGNFLARLVVETGHPEVPVLEALVRGTRIPDAQPGEPR